MKNNPEKKVKNLVAFLKNTFLKAGFSRAVIALSGGLDSSTSCALIVRALGKENAFPVLLPYGKLNPEGIADALQLINNLHIPKSNLFQIDIKKIVDLIIGLDLKMSSIRKGNIMARIRMTILFDLAKKQKAMVVGTENKSEHLLGYFTRFGDEASDIEPLRNLYKTEVYQIARYLNIPLKIINKNPSAGLWENQTDEKEFGFTYKIADQVLYLLHDEKRTTDEIIKKGFSPLVVKKITAWLFKNRFKQILPYLPED